MKKERLLAILSGICSVLLLVALPALAAKGPEITTQGYSIFHETMVDLSWPQVEKAAKDGAIILFPATVIEEHGPAMSLGVDTYMSYLRCKLVRRELVKSHTRLCFIKYFIT